MIIKKGTADVTTYVNLVDSAAGTPETGLTITNIDATYTRNRATAVKNDLTALAAADSAHADNKGFEVDGTNAPGLYRIDWPDAAFLTGADKVILTVTCTGCAPAHLIVELVDYDPADGVRLGLTALPNAAADAAGGLPVSTAGGLDLDTQLGKLVGTLAAGTHNPQTGDSFARLGAPAGASVSADIAAVKSDSAAILTDTAAMDPKIVGTLAAGTHNPQSGDAFARLGAPAGASVSADVAAVKSETAAILADTGTDGVVISAATQGAIADATWDEAIAGHLGAGSTGAALNAAGSAGDPWSTAIPGAYGAGTAGKILGDNINTTISSRAAQTTADAIETDTQDIQSRIPAALTGFGHIKADVLAISGDDQAADDLEAVLDGTGADLTCNITGSVSGSVGSVTGAVGSVAGAVASVTGNVGGNVVGSVGSVIGAVGSVTGAVGSVTGSVGGNVVGSVGSIATDGIAAASVAAAAVTKIQAGMATAAALDAVDNYVDSEVAAIKAVTDKLDSALELDGSVYRLTENALEQAPTGSGSTPAEIADAVWTETLADHSGTAGSAAEALAAAGSAGDPWITPLPGAYAAGTAGADLAAVFNRTGATPIVVQSSVASSGTLTLVEGDDYAGASALTLTRTWPGVSMVGGSIAFYLIAKADYEAGTGTPALGPVACTFTGGGSGASITVTVPLTAAQTEALEPSPPDDPLNYVYQIVGTAAGTAGTSHTLFLGAATVKRGLA